MLWKKWSLSRILKTIYPNYGEIFAAKCKSRISRNKKMIKFQNSSRISGKNSFWRKLEVVVPFLKNQKDWMRRDTSPLLSFFSSKSTSHNFQNFEMAILKSPVTMPFGITRPHTVPGERSVCYRFCPLLRIVFGIGKDRDIFQWKGVNFLLWSLTMGRIFLERELSEEWTFQGKFFTGAICQNSYTKLFLFVLLYICRLSFTCGDVKENRPGEIFTRLELSRVSYRREDLPRDKFSIGNFLLEWLSSFLLGVGG